MSIAQSTTIGNITSDIEFTDDAKDLAQRHVDHYGERLLRQAYDLAESKGQERILENDIHDAAYIIKNSRCLNTDKELLIAIGGGLFGFSVEGIGAECLDNKFSVFTVGLAAMSVIGISIMYYSDGIINIKNRRLKKRSR